MNNPCVLDRYEVKHKDKENQSLTSFVATSLIKETVEYKKPVSK